MCTGKYFVTMLFLAMAFGCVQSDAAETYLVNGKNSTKLEAVRTLISDSKAQVIRCQEVELKENKSSIGFKVKKDKK